MLSVAPIFLAAWLTLLPAMQAASGGAENLLTAAQNSQRQLDANAIVPEENLAKPMFYDQYRVNIDAVPLLYEVPDNVSWTDIHNLQKLTSSAAYDIYRATFLGEDVIVKTLRNQTAKKSRSGAPKEMEKEIKILSRLQHPNIIRILGHGYKPYRFMILEWLGGGTLSRKLNYTYRDHKSYGKERFSQALTFEYATKLADALAYIHDGFHPHVRLFHRDLKSDNIAFTKSGEIKLFDFGLAELIRKAQQQDAVFHLSHGVGSWRYTAPEVLHHDYYNHKSDVFGFGIIFYHMLTGKHPIDNGYNKTEHYMMVVEDGWRPPLDFRWPTQLHRLLARSWNYDVKARPTCAEIVKELEHINHRYPDIWRGPEGGVMIGSTLFVQ